MKADVETQAGVQEEVKKPTLPKEVRLEIALKSWLSATERADAIKEALKPINIEIKSHEETIAEIASDIMLLSGDTELVVGDLGKVVKRYSHVPKIEGEITLRGLFKIVKMALKNDLPIFKGKVSMTGLKALIDNKTALAAFAGNKLDKGKYDKKIRKSFSNFGFKGFVKQISFGIVLNK